MSRFVSMPSGVLLVQLPAHVPKRWDISPMVHSGPSEMACHALKPVVVTAGRSQRVTVRFQLM